MRSSYIRRTLLLIIHSVIYNWVSIYIIRHLRDYFFLSFQRPDESVTVVVSLRMRIHSCLFLSMIITHLLQMPWIKLTLITRFLSHSQGLLGTRAVPLRWTHILTAATRMQAATIAARTREGRMCGCSTRTQAAVLLPAARSWGTRGQRVRHPPR